MTTQPTMSASPQNGNTAQPSTTLEIILPGDWNTATDDQSFLNDARLGKCKICFWDGGPENVMERIEWIKKIRGLEASANSGCVSCQILHSLVKTTVTDYNRNLRVYGFDGQYEIGIADGVRSQLFEKRCFDVFVPSELGDSPCGIAQRPLGGASSRETSIAWAKNQLAHCLEAHKWCQTEHTSFLPTRLINVSPKGANGDVFLQDSSTVPSGSKYVTLSYCWGGVVPECLTTRETLSERQKCMPWTSLPQTFKDAIEFTRSIGVSYIWIDSVCIIQKDAEDWVREGGKMFHVYKNSYITIAAAGKNSLTGLWAASDNWQTKLLATIKLNERSWPLYLRNTHDHFWEWDVTNVTKAEQTSYPLFRRAWCYQERLIGPRAVLFMGGEVAFQCAQKATCECGNDNSGGILLLPLNTVSKREIFGRSLAVLQGPRPRQSSSPSVGLLIERIR